MVHPARRPSRHDEAVGQVVGFLVGGSIFVAALGGILLVARDSHGDGEPAQEAGQTLQAASLLDVLLGSPGVGWADPDNLGRLGLLAGDGLGLDPDSLQALRGAGYEQNASNDLVDYAEARAGLAVPDGTDFHLRMYPIGLDSAYQTSLAGTRVGYVGDWVSLPSTTVALGTESAMLGSAQAQLNLTIGLNTQSERAALAALGVNFTNLVHLTAATPSIGVDLPLLPDPPLLNYLGLSLVAGDVYPDAKSYIDAVLPTRISEYEVLVVGSSIDQNALTSAVTKNAIRDWVLGGGTLIVFGSDSQNFQWLQPLFAVGQTNVNGGAFAPDVSHPLLHEPNPLDWDSYANHGLGWDIKDTGSGAHYEDFTHVVVEGGEDVLAVSNAGAFGTGRIFLTTFRAGEIAAAQGLQEAMALLTNFMLYAENAHLYLEYGPTVPDGEQVAAAIRQSLLWDEELGWVPVRLELHLWTAGA